MDLRRLGNLVGCLAAAGCLHFVAYVTAPRTISHLENRLSSPTNFLLASHAEGKTCRATEAGPALLEQ